MGQTEKKTVRTELPEQDFERRTASHKKDRTAEQNSENGIARMGQPEQNNQDRASRQDRQNRTASTALSG
jgi:hypothetical protein